VTDEELPFDIRDAMRKRSTPQPDSGSVESTVVEGDDMPPQDTMPTTNKPSEADLRGDHWREGTGDTDIERTLAAQGLRDWSGRPENIAQDNQPAIEPKNHTLHPTSEPGQSRALKIIALSWNGGPTQSIQALFRSFPNAENVAYLVVQSVNSCYQTLDFNALNGFTELNVVEAKNNVLVLSGFVYLVPFLHAVTIREGCIRLKEIRVSWPIIQSYTSKFFESVALEKKEHGTGIVLANDIKIASESSGYDVAYFERCNGVEAIMRDGGKVFFEHRSTDFFNLMATNDLIPQWCSAKDIAVYLSSLEESQFASANEKLAGDDDARGVAPDSLVSRNTLDSIVGSLLLDLGLQDRTNHRFFLYSLIYQRMGYLQVSSLQQYAYLINHSNVEREQLSELVGRRWGKPYRAGKTLKRVTASSDADALASSNGNKSLQKEVQALKRSIGRLESKNAALEKDNRKLLVELSEATSLNRDLETVQGSMGYASLVLDKSLFLRRYSPCATNLFALQTMDIGKPLLQLSADLDLLQLENQVKQVLLRRNVVFFDATIDDQLWCLRLAPYLDKGDELIGVVVSWADQGTFQYWHQRIHSHESRLEVVLNNAGIGIVGIDPDGVLVNVNEAMANMLGYESSNLYGMQYQELVHPEDLSDSNQLMQDILLGEQSAFHQGIRYVRSDQKVISVRITCLLLDGVDNNRQVLTMVEDITEQTRLTRQLHQSQKMEALGQLTGGIAHDFNNLLAVIMGHTELARSQLQRPGSDKEVRLKRYMDAVQKSADRAKVLISQMLIFSHGGKSAPQLIHPAVLVREVVAIFESSLSPGIELKVEMEPRVPAIMIDPVQADQMILNLCLNARDAIEGEGDIVISVRRVANLTAECASCHEPVSGDFVEIGVHDTGVGIAPELQAKVFDPFYSTKQVGKGSGLGLSVVHGIVHDHDAHVGLQSEREHGAYFKVWFPAYEGSVPAERSTQAPCENVIDPESLSGSGRVMVVDDEPSLLIFLEELLVSRGYSVVPFSKARQALRYFQQYGEELDMVITDQAMPELSGVELAIKLYQGRPELPVIIYTGSDHDGYYDLIPPPSIKQFLLKPIRPAELLQAVKHHIAVES